MPMQDFHIHLTRLPMARQLAIDLLEAGTSFNNIACEPWEWEKSLELKDFLTNISDGNLDSSHFAFGIHPMIASKTTAADFDALEQILKSDRYAVGECGLDKRYEGYEEGGIQEQIFIKQVEIAGDLNRPIQVHCVGDYSRALRLIKDHMHRPKNAEENSPTAALIPQVVFHRFGGDAGFVKSALKLLGNKVLFSLHADSFRKKSTAAAIREIPQSQVRLETDADESFKLTEKATAQDYAAEIMKQLSNTAESYKKI